MKPKRYSLNCLNQRGPRFGSPPTVPVHGYTMVEILGVIVVIAIIAALAIAGVGNMSQASKQSNASRNASLLNRAVEAYDQAGGLMTAQVPMVVGSAADEVMAFCLLASNQKYAKTGGNFVAAHQLPIISSDPNDFRAVWVSGVTDASPAYLKTAMQGASGARNPTLEAKMRTGEIAPGRFEIIGPDLTIAGVPADAPGILAFSKDGEPCSASLIAGVPSETPPPPPTPFEEVTPTPPPTPTLPPPPVTPTPPPPTLFGHVTVNPPHVMTDSLNPNPLAGWTNPESNNHLVAHGTNFTVTASPRYTATRGTPRYRWSHFEVNGATHGSPTYSFTAGPAPMTLTPVFIPRYFLDGAGIVHNTFTNALTGNGGGMLVNQGEFDWGQTVTARAQAAPGYRFSGWTGAVSERITGPRNQPLPPELANQTTGSRAIRLTSDTQLNPLFTRMWTASGTTNPVNTGSIRGLGTYDEGHSASISVLPNARWAFSGWTGLPNGQINSQLMTMNQNRSLIARMLPTYLINSRTNPAAANALIEFRGNMQPGTNAQPSIETNWQHNAGGSQPEFISGTNATFRATARPGWRFTHWSEVPELSNTSSATTTFPVLRDNTLVAHFIRQYELSTGVFPTGAGRVSSTSGYYDQNLNIPLRFSGNSGYTFQGWSVNGSTSLSNRMPYNLSLTRNTSVTAVAVPAATVRTNVSTYGPGTGGSVSLTGADNAHAGLPEYRINASTVTARVNVNSGYRFTGWSGAASGTATSVGVNVGNSQIPVTRNVTANFIRQWNLRAVAEEGRVENVSPTYDHGSTARARWSGARGYELDRWEIDGRNAGGGNTVDIPMNQDRVVRAATMPARYVVQIDAIATVGGGARVDNMTITITNNSTGVSQTITARASGNGSQSRTARVDARHGDTFTVTWSTSGWGGHYAVTRNGSRIRWNDPGRTQDYSMSGSYTVTTNVDNTDLGYIAASTPLLIDINENGRPDLLAGPNWGLGRMPSTDEANYRKFAFEPGKAPGMWEWIKGDDALLVWDPEGTGEIKDATQLFGNHTFGKTWQDGFEPLATLDKDGDGVLKGEELVGLAVWQDINSDAVSQEGEVTPVTEFGITEIAVVPTRDEQGAWLDSAVKRGEQSLTVWDWISMGQPVFDESTKVGVLEWTDQQPDAFDLEIKGLEPLTMAKGGKLTIYRTGGSLWVQATSTVDDQAVDVIFLARFEGDRLIWGDERLGVMNILLASGEEFAGLTITKDNKYATWSAKEISGDFKVLGGSWAN